VEVEVEVETEENVIEVHGGWRIMTGKVCFMPPTTNLKRILDELKRSLHVLCI
jgi:hypothetical protein